jgi:hypothetical protein
LATIMPKIMAPAALILISFTSCQRFTKFMTAAAHVINDDKYWVH